MSPVEVPLLVVGGGIGGLATALSAARNGLPVHVLEQSAEFGEIGAGLQMGPNASRALDALGVLDDVLRLAVRPGAGVLRDAVGGRELTRLDLGEAFRARYGYPYLVMHRGDLLDVLLEHSRAHPLITLEAGRTVVSSEVRADGADVTCADGTTYRTRTLLAADGLRSGLRRHLSDDEPVCSGYAAYRGTAPRGEDASDDVVIWIGPGLHLVRYPVRAGALVNQVAVFRSPRFHSGESEWGGVDELEAAFAGTCEPVRDAVARVGRDRHWAMYDREPLDTWVTGRLALLGDAAHPMLQYLGQGACQALEDAVEVGARLRDDVDGALEAFQGTRLPKAVRCQTSARPWGDLWHTADPLLTAVRDRMFALRAADDFTELDWLYAGPGGPGPA
ncbi:MAG TPA: FAD-dependent monooxygenase [Umezawaea sp.]|nr:FAD-dependent monooxygenase [Umezawaea sp.]